MTLTEIKETVDVLSNVFRKVVVKDDGKLIVATDHYPLTIPTTCAHSRHITARNIFASISQGYLKSNKDTAIKYNLIEYCQRCEFVFKAELGD